jgi:hypothetical protein
MDKANWQNNLMGNMTMGESKDKQIKFYIIQTKL